MRTVWKKILAGFWRTGLAALACGLGWVTPAAAQSEIQFAVTNLSVFEGNSLAIVLTCQPGANASVRYTISPMDPGAMNKVAPSTPANGTINFNGSPIALLNLNTLSNTNIEGTLRLRITLSNPVNGLLGSQTELVVNVMDRDTMFLFTTDVFRTTEDSNFVQVVVLRRGNTNGPASVDFKTIEGTATEGTDYQGHPLGITLFFMDGQISNVVTIPLLDDCAIETNSIATNLPPVRYDTFTNELSNPVVSFGNAIINMTNSIVWIDDNDTPSGQVAFSYPIVYPPRVVYERDTDGTDDGIHNVSFRVTRPCGSGDIAVDYEVIVGGNCPGTTNAFYNIYNPSDPLNDLHLVTPNAATGPNSLVGTLTWGNNDRNPKDFEIAIHEDLWVELPETFIIRLTNPRGTGGNQNDPTVLASAAEYYVTIDFDDQPAGASMVIFNNASRNYNPSTIFNPNPGANNNIYAVALHEDGAILGGDFTAVNTVPRNGLARVNALGGLDTSFNPGEGANGSVFAVAVYPQSSAHAGKVLVAGSFTSFDGQPRNGIVRLNRNGSVDPTFFPGNGAQMIGGVTPGVIRSILILDDNKILIGGDFETYNSIPRRNLARLNDDGSLDLNFDPAPGANDTVWSLAIQPPAPFTVSFSGFGSNTFQTNINATAPVGSFTLDYNVFVIPATNAPTNGYSGLVRVFYEGRLLFDSGTNTTGQATLQYGLGTSTFLNVVVNQDTNAPVGSYNVSLNIAPRGSASKVIVGGDFTSIAGAPRARIARLNNNGTYDPTFSSETTPDNTVFALLVQPDNRILLGGNFDHIGVFNRRGVARLTRDGALDPTFNAGLGPDGPVYAMAFNTNGQAFIAGEFTVVNGTARTNMARLHADGTVDTSFLDNYYNQSRPGVYQSTPFPDVFIPGNIRALAVNPVDGSVLVGGRFDIVGGGYTAQDVRVQHNYTLLTGGITPPENNRRGNIDFTSPEYTVDENASTALVYLSMQRLHGILGPIQVQVYTVDGSAIAGVDYQPIQQTVTWYACDSLNSLVQIPILDNQVRDGNREFMLVVDVPPAFSTNAVFYGMGFQVTTRVTIVDNDFENGVLGFATPYYYVAEDGSNAVITVTRTNGSNGSVTVQYVALDGTATRNADYTLASGTLTFAAGVTNLTFKVPILNDTAMEPEETILLYLYNPQGGATIGRDSATLIITDNDNGRGSVGFSSHEYFFSESSNAVPITVRRTGGAVSTQVVALIVREVPGLTNGAALNGADFVASTNLLLFANGETTKTFMVPLLSDTLVEGTEQFQVLLATNAGTFSQLGIVNQAIVNILDDDSYGTLEFLQPRFAINEQEPMATLTVVRRGGSSGRVTVEYATEPLTGPDAAIEGVHYMGASGVLVWEDGDILPKTFNVPILYHSALEGNRMLGLRLRNPAKAGLGENGTAVLMIIDLESQNLPAGSVDTIFNASPGIDNFVRALAVQRDGKLIVGGDFTTANGQPLNRIARLHVNGALDTTFDPLQGFNDTVHAVAVQSDGKILAAGRFTRFDVTNRFGIARLNSDGRLDTFFARGSGANNPIFALALHPDGRVAIGGSFNTIHGIERPSLAVLDTNGNVRLSFDPGTGPNGPIYALAYQPDGKLLVGGTFTKYRGLPRNHLVRVNPDGTPDPSFDPGFGPNDSVRAIAVQEDGRIVIGGLFTTVDSQPRGHVARLHPNGSLDTNFLAGLDGADGAVFSLSLQSDGKVVVVGDFQRFNNVSRSRITRLMEDGSNDLTINFGTGADAHIAAVINQSDDQIVIGGGFLNFNGVPRAYLARIIGHKNSGSGRLEFLSPIFYQNENITNAVVTVRRNWGASNEVRVSYATIAGGTASSADYQPVSGELVFPPGEVLATFTVPLINDIEVEEPETIFLTLSNPTNTTLGTEAELDATVNAQLVILSDDNLIGFGSPDFVVNENVPSGFAVLTVQRTGATNNFAAVDIEVIGGTASQGQDYTASATTLTFLPGETLKYYYVNIQDDPRVEGDETVLLALSNPTAGSLIGQGITTLTIRDNDFSAGTLNLELPTYVVNEFQTNLLVRVVRSAGSSGVVAVDYSTADFTAQAGADYTPVSGTLSFAEGETVKTFNVPILQDFLAETNEVFLLRLSNARGAAGVTLGNLNQATVTILDTPLINGSLAFAATNFVGSETSGVVAITVLRRFGSAGNISVAYATTPGTAQTNVNYIPTNGILTWVNGDTTPKTFFVTVLSNNLVQGDLTVGLALANPAGGATLGTPAQATLTIRDVSTGPGFLTFAVPQYTAAENATNALITVLRTNGALGNVSVDYTTADGTGVAGVDYQAATGTLTLTNGQTTATFLVPLIERPGADLNKTVRLSLFNPTNASLGAITNALLTITESSTVAGSVNIGFAPFINGSVDALYVQTNGENKVYIAGTFTMVDGLFRTNVARLNLNGTLDTVYNVGAGPSNGVVRAIVALEDGRAYVGGSFTGFGESTNRYLVRLLPDGSVDTTFNPQLDNAVNTLTVQPDGRLLVGGLFTRVGFNQRAYLARLTTNGMADFTFMGGEGPDAPVRSIALQSDGRILIGGDFTHVNGLARSRVARLLASGMVDTTFNPGAGPDASVRTVAVDDENRVLIGGLFTTVSGVSRGRIARLLPTGALDLEFNPGGGADEFVNSIALQPDGRILLGGAFTTFNGYPRNRLTRLLSNGAVDTTFNIGTGADNYISAVALQADQRIIVAGGFLTFNGVPQAYLARLNNGFNLGPGAFGFAVANFTVAENASNAVLTVVRNIGSAGTVSVDYATSDGTARAGVHYTAVSGTLTFADGETVRTFTVPVYDDTTSGSGRTFRVTLSNPQGGAELGTPASATVLIDEDDAIVGFAQVNYSVNESGGFAIINVERTGSAFGFAFVDYAVGGGTADGGADYEPSSGTLFFLDGQTTTSILVPITDDALIEGNETVQLRLFNPSGVALGLTNATLTIVDNDFGPGTLGFSVLTYQAGENSGIVNITVLRTNGSLGIVSVDYAVLPGTASAGADFVVANGTLQFADGETAKTFPVRLLDDGLSEGNESVLLVLSNPQGGATLDVFNSQAALEIVDDDLTPGAFRFESAQYEISEAGFGTFVTIVRTNGSTGVARVDVITSGGTATVGFDYYGFTNTLIFADGQISTNLFIYTFDDFEVEGPETFNLRLVNPRDGTTVTEPSTAVVTIQDDESLIQFTTANYTVNEDAGTASVAVERLGGLFTTASVGFSTTGGTAVPGSDYTPVSGTLIFGTNESVKNIVIPITDNAITNANKTLNILLFGPSGGAQVGTRSNAVLTIVDNDSYLALDATSYTVGEGDGTAVITIRRTGSLGTPASINFTVGGGTAQPGVHYAATNVTLFFSANESQKTVSIPIFPNQIKDGARTVNIALTFPSRGATIVQGNAVLTILDDDDSIIVPVAAALVSESGPVNGSLDPGETVTVRLALRNIGNVPASNLVATLLATNGVTAPGAAQTYGLLLPGGVSVSRTFTFTVGTTNGGVVRATLSLQDAGQPAGTVVFDLQVGSRTSRFANTGAITIVDDAPANPYPSLINVSGLNGTIGKITVTVSNITHGFPRDISMMLVGPQGQRVVLMGYAIGGWDNALQGVTLTFDDASTNTLPANAAVVSGVYRPTNYFSLAFPAPAPSLPPATNNVLGVFQGTNPNGTWALYVQDMASPDVGQIAGGWSLTISTVEQFAPAADVAVSASASSSSLVANSNFTYTITVQNGGPVTAQNVVVTNLLPAGVTLLNTSASTGTPVAAGNVVRWNVGTLGIGSSANMTLLVSAPNPGVLTNLATVVSTVSDPAAANNLARVIVGVTPATPPSFGSITAAGGQLQLTITGQPGSIYYLEASTNLVQWLRLSTNVLTGPSSTFSVPLNLSDRGFFRIVLP